MSFKMSADASLAFNRLSKQSKFGKLDMWDFYYYCALIGMKKHRISNEKMTEFHKTYTNTYQPLKYVITGLVVSSDLERTGESYTKDNISNKFKRLVDPSSELVLNNEGVELLNQFAEGGYQYYIDRYPGTSEIYDFISNVYTILNE